MSLGWGDAAPDLSSESGSKDDQPGLDLRLSCGYQSLVVDTPHHNGCVGSTNAMTLINPQDNIIEQPLDFWDGVRLLELCE